MSFESWRALYQSEWQAVWALWVVPAAFLVYLLVAGRESRPSVLPPAAGFMRGYALVFAVETMLDPLAGGPLLRWLGLAGGTLQTAVMVFFVLLGDFRVLLLVLAVIAYARSAPSPAWAGARAALWTLVVPLVAVACEAVLRTRMADPPAQSIWLFYELAFVVLALVWRQRLVPSWLPDRPRLAAYLRAVLAYVAVYYALWATADVLIMAGGLDAGWALRIVPNQLYYAFFLPFAYALFFSPSYASASMATQTAR